MNKKMALLSLVLFVFAVVAVIPYVSSGDQTSLNAFIVLCVFGLAFLVLGLFFFHKGNEL